ncbi:MAG: hypothetical protein WC099_02015 [Candidatus Paceibacterota bacterium]
MLIGVGAGVVILVSLLFWFIWKAFSPIAFLKKCDCGSRLFVKTGKSEYGEHREDGEKIIIERSFECFECGKGRVIPRTKGSWGIEVEVVSE